MDAINAPAHDDVSNAMRDCSDALLKRGVAFERKTRWQIKIGPINFYPERGTIFVDGEAAPRQEEGLETLLTILDELKRKATERRNHWRSRYL